MTVFHRYAPYYDLLYADKNYTAEALYVQRLFSEHAPTARHLVEFGSGTGRHAQLLHRAGFDVQGVECSEEMLAQARARCPELTFVLGDMRTVRLDVVFDAALALFHVVSYQTRNENLRAAFQTVRMHLAPGGVFCFDVWYGPAVLSQRPEVRIKRLNDNGLEILRIAEPTLHVERNVVDVHYQILVRENEETWRELRETHSMRYLFHPELELLLQQAGLRLFHAEEWLSGRSPGLDTWGVVFLAAAE